MGNKLNSSTTPSSVCGSDSTVFYASPESLPDEALPSWQDIEAAATCSNGNLLSNNSKKKTFRVGSSFVVKYGIDERELYTEGRALLFLEERTSSSLRFPRLYAMCSKGNKACLVMEYLEGQPLRDVLKGNQSNWSTYSVSDKNTIATILRNGLRELRLLPSPQPGLYCGVDGDPLPDLLSWSPRRANILSGPFATEKAWNDALVNISADCVTPHRLKFLRRCVESVLTTGCQPVFTHGDLQQKNILVKRNNDTADAGTSAAGDKFQVSLVDWETAGWYPCYWEYFIAINTCHGMDDDFGLYLDSHILDDSYPVEFSLCRELILSAISFEGYVH